MNNIMSLAIFLPNPKAMALSQAEESEHTELIKQELAQLRKNSASHFPDGLMDGDSSEVADFLKQALAGLSEPTQRWLAHNQTWV